MLDGLFALHRISSIPCFREYPHSASWAVESAAPRSRLHMACVFTRAKVEASHYQRRAGRYGQAALRKERRMTALRIARSVRASFAVFCRDVGHGLLEVSHNTLALVGLVAVAVLAFAGGHAELRRTAETQALAWLKERHEARAERDGNLLVVLAEVRRRQPGHGHGSPRAHAAAGCRRAMDLPPLPRCARADQPARAGGLGDGPARRRRTRP